MSLLAHFLNDISKAEVNRICDQVGDDEDLMHELFTTVIRHPELIVVRRGLWVLRVISDRKPYLFKDHFDILLQLVRRFPHEDSVLRNVIGIWQVIAIPEEHEGEVFDLCMGFLQNQSAIAAKAFSMEVCYRIVKVYPELKPELGAVVEQLLLKYEDSSPAIVSRGNRTLKKLKKL